MISSAILVLTSIVNVPVRLIAEGPEAGLCKGAVQAVKVGNDAPKSVVVGEPAGEWAVVLGLEPGDWRISLVSPNCWSPSIPLKVSEGGFQSPALLDIWQRAAFTGVLAVRPGDSPPDEVQVEFQPTSKHFSRAESCRVRKATWMCAGPKTQTDVRVLADGFAPIYYWAVGGESDSTRLPMAMLERGASISGWVLKPDRTPAESAEVEVVADTLATRSRVQFAVTAASARSDARGFFQVRGLPPGSYKMRARSSSGTSSFDQVEVPDGRELRVGDLRLEPPSSVEVQILPPRLPDGSPWSVSLDRVTPDGLVLEAPTPSSDDGRWIGERIERGHYRLRISDPRRSVLERRDIVVDRDVVAIYVEIQQIRVQGRVRAGADPVAADLKFESAKGSVEMEADDEGRFEGWLPSTGVWRVQVTPLAVPLRIRTNVDVRVPPGESSAVLNIDLPEGRIRGVVETGDGRPVSGAEVLALSRARVVANALSDADGSFSMFGLAEGSVMLVAQKGREESRAMPHQISSTSQDAVLVLEARELITGRLRMANGRPLPGALIRYLAANSLRSTISGPSGDFELDLPPSVAHSDIVVVALGLPIKIARLAVQAGDHELVVGDHGGFLRIKLAPADRSFPLVQSGPVTIPLSQLLMPADGMGLREADGDAVRIAVEPGTYTVCYRNPVSCSTRAVTGGSIVEIVPPQESKERSP